MAHAQISGSSSDSNNAIKCDSPCEEPGAGAPCNDLKPTTASDAAAAARRALNSDDCPPWVIAYNMHEYLLETSPHAQWQSLIIAFAEILKLEPAVAVSVDFLKILLELYFKTLTAATRQYISST